MTALSVNLNKFALIRNSRGTDFPNVVRMGRRCLEAGARGLTIHPRPDQRHATYDDVADLADLIRSYDRETELNIEGNPIDSFLETVIRYKPHQCTLVPDDPGQLTSDHGWDLARDHSEVQPIIERLKAEGIRVSLFMDADNLEGIQIASEIGADRVELYTEPYAKSFGTSEGAQILEQFRIAAAHALDNGLGVNAGHDLNLQNLGAFLSRVPNVLEVSIGHALVVESFDYGLEETVRRYVGIVL
jgi:pyridoxine 5-phosphate synthase